MARRMLPLLVLLPLCACGVAAAPCRVTGAVFKAIPFVGHAAAAPLDACGNVIDP